MSQIQMYVPGGGPAIPTQFTTEDGVAVPVGNNINIFGDSTAENFNNGITTAASGDDVFIVLTNRIQGSGSTSGAVNATLATFTFDGTPRCINIESNIVGFDSTNGIGCGFSLFGSFVSDGVTVTEQDTQDKINNINAALGAVDCNLIASGNSVQVQATGSVGHNISWNSVSLYVTVA